MSTLALLVSLTDQDKNNSTRSFNSLLTWLYLAAFGLAIYLAIRDMGLQVRSSTKMWVFLLAALEPGLYICLHGISSSMSGAGFFAGSPVVGSGGSTPSFLSSMESTPASTAALG
jgi:hypothetical protein